MFQSSHRNLLTLLCAFIALAAAADARERRSPQALQSLVDGLKAQLGIDAIVSTAIVPTNPLRVSVRPVEGGPGTFQMAFEQAFLTDLDDDDLKAIVAHERARMLGVHAIVLTDESGTTTLQALADGQEVEMLAWRLAWRQGPQMLYRVSCLGDGAVGWVRAELLRGSPEGSRSTGETPRRNLAGRSMLSWRRWPLAGGNRSTARPLTASSVAYWIARQIVCPIFWGWLRCAHACPPIAAFHRRCCLCLTAAWRPLRQVMTARRLGIQTMRPAN